MNKILRLETCCTIIVALTAGSVLAAQQAPSPQPKPAEEPEVVTLSPFTVSSEKDQGYRATSTLAGTRLKTSLRDIGASVSVLTPEFLKDIGATDSESVLSYTLGTETSGVMGNFAGGDAAFSDSRGVNIEATRGEPQTGQRVRGLAAATLTRNYFEIDIAFDSYNSDSVTINRGPNSLLFGIGSPGGIIEASTKEALLSRDSGEAAVRIGARSSYRGTFDYNKVLIKERLALRIAGLKEDTRYEQRPAFKKQDRIYLNLKSVLFSNKRSELLDPTVVRANYEHGKDESTPPSVIPPGDGISSWFSVPNTSAVVDKSTLPSWLTDGSFVPKYTVDPRGLDANGVPRGVNINTVKGSVTLPYFIQMSLVYSDANSAPFIPGTNLNGVLGRTSYNFGGRPRLTWDYFANGSVYNRTYFPGYTVASLPSQVFDNVHVLLPGTTNRVTHDFDAGTVTLEQTFFKGKAGIEASFDKQNYNYRYRLPFSGGGMTVQNNLNDVVIDVQQYLSNDQPNPNVGRMMLTLNADVGAEQNGLASWRERHIDREAQRATAFVDLDLRQREGWAKWLGRHVVTGLYSTQRREIVNQGFGANWISNTVNIYSNDYHFPDVEGVRNTRTQMRAQIYLGPSLLNPNIRSVNDVRITHYIDIPLPKAGDVYRLYTFNRTTGTIVPADFTLRNALITAGMNRRDIDTKAISMQSYLFKDNLVGLVGWREDRQTNTAQAGTFYAADGSIDPTRTLVWGTPRPKEVGRTFSWSLVGHEPKRLRRFTPGFEISPHLSVSENFNPVGQRSTVRGESIQSPTGTTREYGFSLNSVDERFSVRFNWYRSELKNDSADIANGPANPQYQIQDWMRRLLEYQVNGFSIQQEIATAGGPAGVFSSYDDAYAKIVSLIPADVQAIYRFRTAGTIATDDRVNVINPTPTRGFVSRGMEIDAVANVTNQWRLFANVARTQTIQSDIAAEQLALANYMRSRLAAAPWRNMLDSPVLGEQITYLQRFDNNVYVPLVAATIKSGAIALEQRKWRVNAGTNYRFTGKLKGVGVGVAMRWQDRGATGYPLVANALGVPQPDLTRPFWAPSTWNGDAWLSYRRKILKDRFTWSVQLNARNLVGDRGAIPVATNPDGQLAVFRNPNPREFYLTNTVSF